MATNLRSGSIIDSELGAQGARLSSAAARGCRARLALISNARAPWTRSRDRIDEGRRRLDNSADLQWAAMFDLAYDAKHSVLLSRFSGHLFARRHRTSRQRRTSICSQERLGPRTNGLLGRRRHRRSSRPPYPACPSAWHSNRPSTSDCRAQRTGLLVQPARRRGSQCCDCGARRPLSWMSMSAGRITTYSCPVCGGWLVKLSQIGNTFPADASGCVVGEFEVVSRVTLDIWGVKLPWTES